MSARIRFLLNRGSIFSYAYLAWFEIMEEADDLSTLKNACEIYREYETAELLDLLDNARHTTDKLMRLREEVRTRHTAVLEFLESQCNTLMEKKIQESQSREDSLQKIDQLTEHFKNILRDNQAYRHKMPSTMAKRVAMELLLEMLKEL